MEKLNDKEFVELLANWLKIYSDNVVKNVMKKVDEIKNNDFAISLLKELYDRENDEYEDFLRSIDSLYYDYDKFSEYDVHNHPLSHAKSYRDVLDDMFIR